ncbi:hypothetical protein WJX74_010592 [Apatococcus lobatus]|uniref:PH domain-containing protein n=1 Tax=Apatococcus lobatus TaxID=904363 RepID=A0AAW1QKA6_9CHLO
MAEPELRQAAAESGILGRFGGSAKIAEPSLVQHPLQGLSLLAPSAQTPPASPEPYRALPTAANFTERLFQRDRPSDHSSTLRRSQSASSLPVELPEQSEPAETSPPEELGLGHFIGFTDGLSRAHSHDSIPSPSIDLERQPSGRRPVRRPLSSIEISLPAPPQSPDQRPHLAPAHSDSFTRHLMNQALRFRSAVLNSDRVSFMDIARAPGLARKARAELDGRQHSTTIETDQVRYEVRAHEEEIERQRDAVDAVDEEAAEEGRINRDLATVMVARLDAGRRAAEKLLGVLQAISAAEVHYARSIRAAAQVSLAGECDGQSLRTALQGFSQMPRVVSHGREQIGEAMGRAAKQLYEVVLKLRQEEQDIAAAAKRTHKAFEAARRGLHTSLLAHQDACRAMDTLILERKRGHRRAPPSTVERDPWLTEILLVEAHGRLQEAQSAERTFLASAFQRVKDVEARRILLVRSTIETFQQSYKSALAGVRQDLGNLTRLASQIDGEADLSDLAKSAEAAAETGRVLAEKQAEALENVSQELLHSPEIIKQGSMACWVSGHGKWTDRHCVLTRAGYLHWFNKLGDSSPIDCLNLARCHFQAGKAPILHIVELMTGAMAIFAREREVVLKAPGIDECLEWAVTLREAIAHAHHL